MQVNIDPTKWWQRIYAALIFFTRLPFWRLYQPPQACYKSVVEHWPLVGWLTGGTMAVIIYVGSMFLPYTLAILLAIVVRVLITGALHEDGLTDFFDGFGGGGNDRERILAIMKDSRIGTYGVLGIIFYELILFFALYSIPPVYAALAVFADDAYSKMVAGQIIMFLPYARTEETSKTHTVYRRFNTKTGIGLFIQGILPLLPLLYWENTWGMLRWNLVVFVPCIVMYVLYYMMNKKLHGYTGDCCGALFLLIELAFYLTVAIQLHPAG